AEILTEPFGTTQARHRSMTNDPVATARGSVTAALLYAPGTVFKSQFDQGDRQMFHPRSSPAVTISLLTLMTCFLIQSQAQTSRQTVRSDSTKSALPSKTASTDELFDTKETNLSESEMRSLIERYTVDRGSLTRSYPGSISLARQALFRHFYSDWLAQLQKLNFDSMSQEGKVDYLLL